MKKWSLLLAPLLVLSASAGFFSYQFFKEPDVELSSNMVFYNNSDDNFLSLSILDIEKLSRNILNNQSILNTQNISPEDISRLLEAITQIFKQEFEENEGLEESDEDSKIKITPVNPVWTSSDEKTFSALEETATGEVALKGLWTFSNRDEEASCADTPTCSLESETTGDFTAYFEAKNEKVSMPYKVKVPSFSDAVPSWASNAVETMREFGLIQGYGNGDFGSGDPLTRAQIALVVFRAMEAYSPFRYEQFYPQNNCETRFDIPADHWAFQAICFGDKMLWFQDLNLSEDFKMNQAVTRAEMTSILKHSILMFSDNEIIGDPDKYYPVFKDVPEGHAYSPSIMNAYLHGIITGTLKNNERYFYPEKVLNRAEFATMMYRTLSTLSSFNKPL